jgi:hypothetical protein
MLWLVASEVHSRQSKIRGKRHLRQETGTLERSAAVTCDTGALVMVRLSGLAALAQQSVSFVELSAESRLIKWLSNGVPYQ